MENLIGTFARQSGIMPQIASIAIPLISKFILQRASPQKASGLMSMLPSGLTDAFSEKEKTEFTTKQEDVSQDDVVQDLANKCFNGDKSQAQKVFQEVTKLLNERTGEQGQGIIREIVGKTDQSQV